MNFLFNSSDGEMIDSVGLLMSVLVRYPEVASIKFQPKDSSIKLLFLLTKILDEKEFEEFNNYIYDTLKSYYYLEKRRPLTCNITKNICENIMIVEVQRDVKTLSQSEIALIVSLIYNYFRKDLVKENQEALYEEELLFQEELIANMLDYLRSDTHPNALFAFREDGRVVVFNK